MKLYKKVNKYILEHYPIAWNTNIVWMLCSALLLHLLMFGLGYISTTIGVIKSTTFSNNFFNSSIYLLYIIILLVIGILWLIKLYKNNPIKSIYQIKKGYLFIVYAHIFIILIVHVTAMLSFDKAKQIRTQQLINEKELVQEIDAVNRAVVFIVKDNSKYQLSQRGYPYPFSLPNVKVIYYENVNKELNYEPELKLNPKKPTFQVNSVTAQCVLTSNRMVNCKSYSYVDSVLDISKMYGLKEHSLYNYNDNYIDEATYTDTNKTFANYHAPTIHRWLQTNATDSMEAAVVKLKAISAKYNSRYTINAKDVIATVLKYENLDGLRNLDFGFSYNENYNYTTSNKGEVYIIDELNTIAENYYDIKETYTNATTCYGFLFFAIILAYLIMLGKFAKGIDIILAAVMCGVLSIIFSLLSVVSLRGSYGANTFLKTAVFYVVSIIIASYLIVFYSKLSKKIKDKLILIIYFAIPLLLCLIMSTFYYNETYEQKECGVDNYRIDSFSAEPWHFIIIALVSIIPAFILIKKWIAKPE